MKKLYILLLTLGIFVGCKEKENPTPRVIDHTWEEPYPNELVDSTLGQIIDSCKRLDPTAVTSANAHFIK